MVRKLIRTTILRRLLIFGFSAWLVIGMHLPAHSQIDGLGLALQAQQLTNAGRLSEAALAWQSAAAAFAAQNDRQGKIKSLINQSQVLQDLGFYPRACQTLLDAFERSPFECNISGIKQLIEEFEQRNRITLTEGIGLRSLGNVLQHQGMLDLAQKTLELSLTATTNSSESAATWLTMGNVLQSLGARERDRWSYDQVTEIIERQSPNKAFEPYLKAFQAYNSCLDGELLTQTQAQLNHLSLLIEIESWWQQQTQRRIESWQRLGQSGLIELANNFSNLLAIELEPTKAKLVDQIAISLPQLAPTHSGIYAHLNYVQSLTRLKNKYNQARESILLTALQQARQIEDRRAESYALGYLGQNYATEEQLDRAIVFTNKALAVAETLNANGDAREISYLWQSQLGKLLERANRTEEAIAAYRLAFNTLQSLRTDLNTNNQVIQFNFRQQVKPVYVNLANLLLSTPNSIAAKSVNFSSSDKTSDNLEEARRVIESLQLAELDNFFQDPCSPTSDVAVTIDDLDPEAAVIYPIVFSDRLEIILSMAGKPLERFTTKISTTAVDRTLDALYDSLYNQSVNNSAVNIFSTTPLNPIEVEENIQALLPNLQEIYRWSIEPIESELVANKIKTLVFVLSGKLQNVPMAALYDGKQYLLEKYGVVLAPSLQLLNAEAISSNKLKVLAAGLSQQVEVQGEIFPALTNVVGELQRIEQIFPRSQQLLDEEFTLKNIEQLIQQNFSIVHLATHGSFSSDPAKTFIVTGDRNMISLTDFSTLLGSSRNRPELVVLSACDTATGDERAVLGLAGVAVRSGSSTVASLWSVEDKSTSRLMSRFYRRLENSASKVEALQHAQLSLVEDLRANPPLAELKQLPPHPYYWASYVLVGNWQ